MAKKFMQMTTQELVESGSDKAVAELERRVAKTGSKFAKKALETMGVGDTEDNALPPNRVALEQVVADSSSTPDLAALVAQVAKTLGLEFPQPAPAPAAKTRKVKTVNVPPAFDEPTLMAMSRDQLKQLAGVEPKKRTRTATLVQMILANQEPKPQPKHTTGEYLTGIKGTKTLTDDGIILAILGASQKDDNGEWLDEAAQHPASGAVGHGNTAKEAMHALNDGLSHQGYRIGWKSNYFTKVDERSSDHLVRTAKTRNRNTNKSAVLTADIG